jgi:hypothetical protein
VKFEGQNSTYGTKDVPGLFIQAELSLYQHQTSSPRMLPFALWEQILSFAEEHVGHEPGKWHAFASSASLSSPKSKSWFPTRNAASCAWFKPGGI